MFYVRGGAGRVEERRGTCLPGAPLGGASGGLMGTISPPGRVGVGTTPTSLPWPTRHCCRAGRRRRRWSVCLGRLTRRRGLALSLEGRRCALRVPLFTATSLGLREQVRGQLGCEHGQLGRKQQTGDAQTYSVGQPRPRPTGELGPWVRVGRGAWKANVTHLCAHPALAPYFARNTSPTRAYTFGVRLLASWTHTTPFQPSCPRNGGRGGHGARAYLE